MILLAPAPFWGRYPHTAPWCAFSVFLCPLHFLQISVEFRDFIDSGLIYFWQDNVTGGGVNVKVVKH